MEKDKRLMEASWWERLTEGKIGSCSDGWGHAQWIFNPIFCWWVELSSLPAISVQSLSCDWLFVIPWQQPTRPPCPSPTSGVYPKPCPLSQWCHPTISSSVVPFSSCPQSFPASGSFPTSQFFPSGGQSIGVSASALVLAMNIQCWYPLGLTGLISLLSKRLSRVFSSIIVQRHQFFGAQPFYCPALTSIHDYWKNHSWLSKQLSRFKVNIIK